MSEYRLKLYVIGQTPRAERAIANLRELCEREFDGRSYEVEVIDILENPQIAEQEKIIATPMLVMFLPPPMRRVIGDLSDSDKVLAGLGLGPLPPRNA